MSQPSGSAAPSLRLAAIMFTDLVGYSALSHRDGALASELLDLHRAWIRGILPLHGGREIATIGDAFLVEFASALAAVECAAAIQRRFAEYNAAAKAERRMELRIGIHLGDIEYKDDNVVGDGVNIASRIHGLAPPGGICVSEPVFSAARNRTALRFTSIGTPALKNIPSRLEIFTVGDATARVRTPLRWRRYALLAAVVGAVVLASALAPRLWRGRPGSAPPSVAVLPFENLSADPENAFFTDGLHDTVIGHLSRVSGLKVISRTSVMVYRGKPYNLREIGAQLGVAQVVEGSVQRAGGHLRVVVQLIDAATDTHLWSQEYDRDLADVFAVQADIAQRVAEAVHTTLTPQEVASIRAIPTKSQDAYDLYIKALLVERRMFEIGAAMLREAIGWLDRAIEDDPAFALAYALRSQLHEEMAWDGFDPTDARRRQAADDAATALRLAPDLAEARIARALVLYHGERRYDDALQWLEQALAVEPGNALAEFWTGTIHRRKGQWERALSAMERAVALDPLNEVYLKAYSTTLQQLRRYEDADRILARLDVLAQDKTTAAVYHAFNTFYWSGDLGPLEAALTRLPADFDPDCEKSGSLYDVAMLKRRFAEAIDQIRACPQGFLALEGVQVPLDYYVALAEWSAGRRDEARALASRVRGALMRVPPDASPGSRRGSIDAFVAALLGDQEAARKAVESYLAALPKERDAEDAPERWYQAALVYAILGNTDRALDELRQSLDAPSGAHAHELKLQPLLDPLRGDPRFERLIAEHLPPKPAAQ